MAVIINELEVITDTIKPTPAAPATVAAVPTKVVSPDDLADVLERQARQSARLLAH